MTVDSKDYPKKKRNERPRLTKFVTKWMPRKRKESLRTSWFRFLLFGILNNTNEERRLNLYVDCACYDKSSIEKIVKDQTLLSDQPSRYCARWFDLMSNTMMMKEVVRISFLLLLLRPVDWCWIFYDVSIDFVMSGETPTSSNLVTHPIIQEI